MSEFYDQLTGFGETLGSLFAWLPPEFSAIIVAAFGILFAWLVVSLALKIIGIFF